MGEADTGWDPMNEAYQSAEFNQYGGHKFPSRQSGEENLCLFVSGFPSAVTSHAVRNLLSAAGEIMHVKTVPDRKRWNCVIAYVYTATYKDALAIIGGFNNFSFSNSTLRVGFAARRKPLPDAGNQIPSNVVGPTAQTRGSFSGLNQLLSDVETLGTSRPGKTDVMGFKRVGPQQLEQKCPMGRSKLLLSYTSDEVRTTIGHGVGLRNYRQQSSDGDSCRARMDKTAAAGVDEEEADVVRELPSELQKKCHEQVKQLSSSSVKRQVEENETKGSELASCGIGQNGHQMDVSSSVHSSVPSSKKYSELCAFCRTPGKLFCSVCKTTYCSHNCQRNDWPHHKNVCQSKLSKSDSLLNFVTYDNDFVVGVDVDELSSNLEIKLQNGDKLAPVSTKLKLKESSLPIDIVTEVVLATEPVSPSEIWFVEKKNARHLNDMKKSLEKHYSGLLSTPQSTLQLMLNDYCVSLFKVDVCWYRTRIESVNRDGTFDVRYVDYGNTETVPLSRMGALEEEFCSVPTLAVCCRLADLVPADGSGVWSNRALKLCSDLLPVLQVYKVRCIQKTANVHSIVLVNPAGRNISNELIEAGVAKRLSKTSELSADLSNHQEIPKERILQTACKDNRPGDSLSPLPLSPSGSEVVQEMAKFSHGMPTAAKHLFRGAKVRVRVLNIVSPGQFWIHLLSDSNDLEKLPQLEANMKEHYESKPSQKGFSITARMLYAAKCSRSDRWLRVHVLNFDRSGVDAFLLDYGVCQAMSLVSLISLEGQFCSLPFQAVQCTLAGIRPTASSKAWTQGTVSCFQRLVSQTMDAGHLDAAVCQMDGSCVHLELMLPSGETVNDLLVKYGLAEFVPDLQPGFFVLGRNCPVGVETKSEGKASKISPLNLQISGTDPLSGEADSMVEGLLKRLGTPPIRLPTSSATPRLKDLVRSPLVKDKVYEVIVTDATHFFGFYVQVVTIEKATSLQTLEERLNDIYRGYRGSFCPSVGDIVAARFSADEKWYRGLIREITSPDSALVMFLDYGNCDNVALKFISPLDASLLTFPVFAYRCTLLEPAGVVFVRPWNPDCLLPLSATFQMKVQKENENVHVVDLFSKDHNINWRDKLIRDGVIQLKLESSAGPSKAQSSSSSCRAISSSLNNKFTSSVAVNRPKLEVGSAVVVVHVNTVADFYVHMEDENLEKAFLDLMQRLKNGCIECTLSSYVPNGPGEIVGALYDGIWYRAKVLQIMSSSACKLEFVDFGNIDIVACNHLRPLPLGCQLDVLTEMAVPCCLFDVSAAPKGGSGDCPDGEFSKWFKDLCLEKQFTVSGVYSVSSNRYAVDLKSMEMPSTVRDCYLKMFSNHQKPSEEKCLGTHLVNSSFVEQQLRAQSASFTQRSSDKRVRFANDAKCLPKAQSSGSSLGPTPSGNSQSGFRSNVNSQLEFRSAGNNQFGFRSTGNNPSELRSAGCNWSGSKLNMINGTGPRSVLNSQPKVTGNNQPGSKIGENDHSGPKATEHNQPGPKIKEGNQEGTKLIENNQASPKIMENNHCGPKIMESNQSGSKVTESSHLDRKITESNQQGPKGAENESIKSGNLKSRSVILVNSSQSDASKDIDAEKKSADTGVFLACGETVEKSPEPHAKQQQLKNVSTIQKLPKIGTLVCIVHVNTPSDFFVQVCNDQQMRDLLGRINKDCNSADSVAHRPKKVGELVAALFEGLWYRAQVLEMMSEEEVRLLFIDFGNTSVTNVRDVRILSEGCQEHVIPRQAIRCRLRTADGFSGDWTPQAFQWFKQNCEASCFLVSSIEVQSSDGVCLVDLKTPESLELLFHRLLVQQSATTEDPLLPHGKADAMERNGQAAEESSCDAVAAGKGKHLQILERSSEVTASKSSPRRPLPVVGQPVCIVHVNSPSDFYVQLFDDESKEQMAKFLADFHHSALELSDAPYSNGKVGDIVAGLFDNCWFRAEVVELLANDRARLFFVDYGNVSVVEYRNIRSALPMAVLSRPSLAVHCAVEGLVGKKTNGEWGEDAIAWFRQRFENEVCTVRMVLVPVMGNHLCMVELVGTKSNESIKELLISNQFGQAVSENQVEKTIRLETELNMALNLTANSSEGNVTKKVAKVEDDMTDLLQKNIVTHDPLTCNTNVKVIHANAPSEFFVQLADEAVQMSIARLCFDLTTHCSLTRDSYRPSAVGEHVAGLFDGMWFRAQVLTILPQDRFELFFVDFGNVDTVDASNIRALSDEFFSALPQQSIRCGLLRLAGSDVAEKWSHKSCAWFKTYCENFCFRVQSVVLDESGKCLVDMVREGDRWSVREQLLSSGQAVDLTNEAKSLDESGEETSVTIRPEQAAKSPPAITTSPKSDVSALDLGSGSQELSGNLPTSVTDQLSSAANQCTAPASNATSATVQHTAAANIATSVAHQPTATNTAHVGSTASCANAPTMAALKPGLVAIHSGDIVTIVHVNSPSDFYVQLQADSVQHALVEMLKKLNEWCTSGAEPYCPTAVGEIVAANFEGIWFRAEVLGILQDSKFQLQFVDYGNVDVTDFVDIRRLPAELVNALPRQAVACAVDRVMPVELNECWSDEAVRWFRENTENVSSFVVRSSSLTPQGKYLVDVCTVLPSESRELGLRQMLVSLKFGRESCPVSEADPSSNGQSCCVSDIQSTTQSKGHPVTAQSDTRLRSQSNGQSSSQSNCLSVIAQSNSESGAQSSGQLSDEPVPKDSDGDRVRQEVGCTRPVFTFSDLPQLQLSSDVPVEVTVPTNPGSFWCQDLLRMADMISHFQFQAYLPPSSADPCHHTIVAQKNEVCLGFHDKYGEWYRIVVKDVLEDRLAVRFIDYGDETLLPLDHIRSFPAELKSFPPLAFHCSLAGIRAVGDGWTEKACTVFQSLVSSQIMTVSIQSKDSKTDNCDVALRVQSTGQLVSDELVMTGLAKHI